MSRSLESIPSYMIPLLELDGDFPLVRALNCFCVSAVYHNPELLGRMGDDFSLNHYLAFTQLFESDHFRWVDRSFDPGTINVYLGNHSPQYYLKEKPTSILHVSANLAGGQVLSKFGSGVSRCTILPLGMEQRLCQAQNMVLQKISLRPC